MAFVIRKVSTHGSQIPLPPAPQTAPVPPNNLSANNLSSKNGSNSLLKASLSNSRNSVQISMQGIDQKSVVIEPDQVEFHNYEPEKAQIVNLTLKNQSSSKITFKIVQPKRSYCMVRTKHTQIMPKDLIELFVRFNPLKEQLTFQDFFGIYIDDGAIYLTVPISVKWAPAQRVEPTAVYRKHKKSQSGLRAIRVDTQTEIMTQSKHVARIISRHSLSNPKLSDMISNYIKRYQQIQEIVKEKIVKNQIFLGVPPLSQQQSQAIVHFNKTLTSLAMASLQSQVASRTKVELSQEKPAIQHFQTAVTWSLERNNPRITFEKGLEKMQHRVSIFIMKKRFNRVHLAFTAYCDYVSEIGLEELLRKEQHHFSKIWKKIERKSQMSSEFNFDTHQLDPLTLPLSYGSETSKKDHLFEINPRVGFDNWVLIEEAKPYNHEIYSYQKLDPIEEWFCHPILQETKRKCSSSEHPFRKTNTMNMDLDFQIAGSESPFLDYTRAQVKGKGWKYVQSQSGNLGLLGQVVFDPKLPIMDMLSKGNRNRQTIGGQNKEVRQTHNIQAKRVSIASWNFVSSNVPVITSVPVVYSELLLTPPLQSHSTPYRFLDEIRLPKQAYNPQFSFSSRRNRLEVAFLRLNSWLDRGQLTKPQREDLLVLRQWIEGVSRIGLVAHIDQQPAERSMDVRFGTTAPNLSQTQTFNQFFNRMDRSMLSVSSSNWRNSRERISQEPDNLSLSMTDNYNLLRTNKTKLSEELLEDEQMDFINQDSPPENVNQPLQQQASLVPDMIRPTVHQSKPDYTLLLEHLLYLSSNRIEETKRTLESYNRFAKVKARFGDIWINICRNRVSMDHQHSKIQHQE